jgi:hypothetical protein
LSNEGAWVPVVAEREQSTGRPETPFPCRSDFNRYTGCIGARKCRATGVKACILGRWPDERPAGKGLGHGLVEATTTPLTVTPAPEKRLRLLPTSPAAPPRATAGRRAATARTPITVGIVYPDRRTGQRVCRQLANAGYETIWFSSAEAACHKLRADAPVSALLVDGALAPDQEPGATLVETASRQGVPVLSLPAGLRDQFDTEPAVRMAVVWLTITLQKQARAV